MVKYSRWTGSARAAEVRFESPVARQLIARQLRAAGAEHRLPILNAEDFSEIWKDTPKAEDAVAERNSSGSREPFRGADSRRIQ